MFKVYICCCCCCCCSKVLEVRVHIELQQAPWLEISSSLSEGFAHCFFPLVAFSRPMRLLLVMHHGVFPGWLEGLSAFAEDVEVWGSRGNACWTAFSATGQKNKDFFSKNAQERRKKNQKSTKVAKNGLVLIQGIQGTGDTTAKASGNLRYLTCCYTQDLFQ